MQTILFATAIAGGAYFLLSARRFDLFTLAFVSSCVYFLPGFFGCVPMGLGRETTVALEHETYLVMAVVLGGIAAGAWMFDPYRPPAAHDEHTLRNPYAAPIALLLAALGLVMTWRTGGETLFSPDKEEVLSVITRWFYLLGVSASLAVLIGQLNRQRHIVAVALMMLMFTMYVGFRADLAMSVIAAFLLRFHGQGVQRLLYRNQLSVFAGAAAALFFFSYKLVYRLVKLGEFDLVLKRVLDPQFHVAAILESEPFATQMVLNEVIRTRFTTDFQYILDGVAAVGVFFSEQLGIPTVSFNELFQPVLFPDIEWGMAGNIWAQMFAAGGWPLLLAFLALFVLTLRIGSRWLSTPRASGRAMAALGGSYWAFYIHRNDLAYQLMLEKRVLFIGLAILFAAQIAEQLARPAARPSAAPKSRGRVAERALPIQSNLGGAR